MFTNIIVADTANKISLTSQPFFIVPLLTVKSQRWEKSRECQLGKILDKEAVAKEAAEKEAHEAKMREQAEAAAAKKAEEAKMAEPASVSADENSDKNKIS